MDATQAREVRDRLALAEAVGPLRPLGGAAPVGAVPAGEDHAAVDAARGEGTELAAGGRSGRLVVQGDSVVDAPLGEVRVAEPEPTHRLGVAVADPAADLDAWQDAIEIGWEAMKAERGIDLERVQAEIDGAVQADWDDFVARADARQKKSSG